MLMRIGLLSERVCVQKCAHIPDGLGGYTVTWADGPTVWANIIPLSKSKHSNGLSYRVRLRNGVHLNSTMRFKWRNSHLSFIGEPVEAPDLATF